MTDPVGGAPLTGTTDVDGILAFDAEFRPGIEYVLSETIPPDGYRLLPAGIQFKVIDNVEEDIQTAVLVNEAELNALVSLELSVEDDKPVLKIHVMDQPGYLLPETGGAGTLLFTMGGTLLPAGSLLLGYALRRKRESLQIKSQAPNELGGRKNL